MGPQGKPVRPGRRNSQSDPRNCRFWDRDPTGEVALDELITPFRLRYERSCALDLGAQLEECADYLQNPEVLIAEFLESYYQVEGKLDPDRHDAIFEASHEELVLEPYFDSLVLTVQSGEAIETIRCLAGAFAPLPGELHPALEQKGVDYVGVREASQRIVLGVSDTQRDATGFCLLLRALNCLAELAPPFQVTRLRRHVLRDRVDPEPAFDLQIGIAARERAPLETALLELTRDLAEMFKRRIGDEPQFADAIGRIECLEIAPGSPGTHGTLRLHWRA
ncbi:MAG TPA: hypothetical protein VKH41_05150 [Myxococcota bacterium]|nr:hypothetical protein [Myxococcota bacterium]